MRTLTQMVKRLKIHLRAAENLTWKETDFVDGLEEAARRMWRHILDSPARRCLRAFASSVLPANGVVELPEDCMRVERVEMKCPGPDDLWHELKYLLPTELDEHAPRWPWHFFPHGAIGWGDTGTEGTIQILGVHPGATIRVVYYQEPVFPFEDGGTFRRPDAGSSDTYPGIPELADAACEHFAAALMSGEEISDQNPIGYHGQQYTAMLNAIAKSTAIRPSRSYVRRARRI